MTAAPLEDANRQQRLDSMKRSATGLLVLMTIIFAISRALESRHPWLGYLRAAAEAAMVGGIADWFAVTALFRHPLGIPIPHTAIIPARKDRIGRSLGGFVQRNFLSRDVILAKLTSMQIAYRLATWVHQPENARRIARHVAAGLGGAVNVLRDEDVQAMVGRTVLNRVRRVQVAPLLGNLLSLMTSGNKHQEILDEALQLVARLVAENEETLRNKIRNESPWWVPEVVDNRIHDKIVTGIERTLREVSSDPHHALRERFDDVLGQFIERLRTSPDTIARAELLKEELLDHPAVMQFSVSLWTDAKAAIVRYAAREEREAPDAIEQGLVALAGAVLADPALVEKVEGWITDAVLYAVEQARGEVGELIAQTVGNWDPEDTSRKIELSIGRDLQFIRINGTLVGALVGLALYSIGKMVG
jgi:uncharacterized membrane-anchored protein YjiN (DUF445 family)